MLTQILNYFVQKGDLFSTLMEEENCISWKVLFYAEAKGVFTFLN